MTSGPPIAPIDRLKLYDGGQWEQFVLETYGHLIDGDLGPALDLRKELPPVRSRQDPRVSRG